MSSIDLITLKIQIVGAPQSIEVAESLKLLAQFCQSYHFLMHKVTSFQSLKVRFTDLIKRKMDLCDFERLFSI